MMESSALFGPSVHTICAGQRMPISETREIERADRGSSGRKGAHLGLALHRGCPREDIVHPDVRHGDPKQATEGAARPGSRYARGTIERPGEKASRRAGGPEKKVPAQIPKLLSRRS